MSRRFLIFAAAAALASVGISCGDEDTGVAAGGEPGAATTTTADADGSAGTAVAGDDGRWEPYVMPPGGPTGTRTSADGRSLLITFVGGAPYVDGQPCTIAYRAEVISSSGDEVGVRLFSNAPPPPDDEPWGCTDEGYSRSVEVDLDAPLGDRVVVEEDSQRRLNVFDGSLLTEPTWMPDGWSLRNEQAGYPDPETALYWERTWGPEPVPPTGDMCTPADGPISLTQGPSSGPERDISHLEPVSIHDVGGATATYYEERPSAAHQVALAWESNGQEFLVGSGPSCFDEGAASLERLLQFARALAMPDS